MPDGSAGKKHALSAHTLAVQGLLSLQTTPQAPQLLALVNRNVSQPVFGSPSQSAKPAKQTKPHWPFVQLLVALGRLQTLPQVPQLLASLPVSEQTPLHNVWPDGQVLTH